MRVGEFIWDQSGDNEVEYVTMCSEMCRKCARGRRGRLLKQKTD